MLMQVAPGYARSRYPENPIQNKAVISWTPTATRAALNHEGLKAGPFLITHQTTDHDSFPKSYLESETTRFGNPLCQHLLGLDTGYGSITEPLWEMLDHPDCHLPDQVMDWIKPSLERTAGKGTILLSHHQPYSFYNPGYPKIAQQIVTLLGGPVLWFWRHEHCLSIYDRVNPAGSLEVYGRCVGHGGMPCERPGSQSNGSYPVLIQDHRPGSLGGPFWRNGYSMLDFDGPKLRIEYRDDGDALVAHEAWEVDGGVIKATVPPIADVSGVGPPV